MRDIKEFLSKKGERLVFPLKGIITQSAQATKYAKKINATIGTSLEDGQVMVLNSVKNSINNFDNNEIASYTGTAGNPLLRELWQKDMLKKNPSLKGINISEPIVTSGLTAAINIGATLFVDEGDTVIYPDFNWGNYDLIFEKTGNANVKNFPLFNKEGGFNTSALKRVLLTLKDNEKVTLVLNFPNNPTGYTPLEDEAKEIVKILKNQAKRLRMIIICDDAYFGLFFEEKVLKQSIFALLAKEEADYLLLKADGCSKEYLAWGFRVAFLTFYFKDPSSYELLDNKVKAVIRSQVSSSSTLSQNLMIRALSDKDIEEEKQEVFNKIYNRYWLVKEEVSKRESKSLTLIPFNSGYFFCFKTDFNSSLLREALLKEGIGVISIKDKYIRIAFSSVDIKNIKLLLDRVYALSDEIKGEINGSKKVRN